MASNKDLVRRFNDEVWNAHKPDLARNYCSNNVMYEESGAPPAQGPDGIARVLRGYFEAFPDMHCDIKAIAEDGPWVGVWFNVTGTHRGQLLGIPPTNRRFSVDVVEMMKVENGKLSQLKGTWNVAEVANQLGIDVNQMMSAAQQQPSA